MLLSLGLNASAIVGVSHWWNGHERRIPVSEWLSILDLFPKLKPEEPEPIEIALEDVQLPPELERKLEEKDKPKPKPEPKGQGQSKTRCDGECSHGWLSIGLGGWLVFSVCVFFQFSIL